MINPRLNCPITYKNRCNYKSFHLQVEKELMGNNIYTNAMGLDQLSKTKDALLHPFCLQEAKIDVDCMSIREFSTVNLGLSFPK